LTIAVAQTTTVFFSAHPLSERRNEMQYANRALAWGIAWSLLVSQTPAADAPAAEAQLEIRKFQLSYDGFGPVRHDASFYPGERLCCRYDIHGCGMTEAGQMELEVTCQLTDAQGKVRSAFSNSIKGRTWTNSAGFARVRSFHAFAHDYRPGRYQLELIVEDKLTQRETKVAQEVIVKPVALALVSPKFYHDARRECPAPLSGLIDQALYVDVEVIGEDRSQGKAAFAYSFEILDAEGNNVLREGAPQEAKLDDPAFIQDRSRRPVIHWTLPLRQVGRYTLRLTVADQLVGGQAQLDLPLEVRDPSEPGMVAAN
jgi:hypothetical protein